MPYPVSGPLERGEIEEGTGWDGDVGAGSNLCKRGGLSAD